MRRKSAVLLLSVIAIVYLISFIGFMKLTFQDSINSGELAQRMLGLSAKQRKYGGGDNLSRFFSQGGSLRDTEKPKLLLELFRASKCQEMPTNSEYFGDRWTNTTRTRDEFVYAAYKDGDIMRILGATVTFRDTQPIRFCKIWYKDKEDKFVVSVVLAQLSMIPEDHGTKFSAAYFICPLDGQLDPVAVSLGERNDTSTCKQPILPVSNAKPPVNDERNFSVCVSPLNMNYSRAYQLIEWIELNKILGVQYFTFYNYSTASNTEQVLSFYSKRGLVEVLPWNMPLSIKNPEEIHYFGQLAALNDCLHRNRHKTKYLAFLDIDEFIIPKQNDVYTWSKMLKRLPTVSSYGFRNVFFRRNWNSLKSEQGYSKAARKYRLITLTKFRRDKFVFPMYSRSKLIVEPKKIETVGIHNVWGYKEGVEMSDTLPVDEGIGLLHHYRFWNNTDTSSESVIDKGVLKYKDGLITHVKQVWSNLTDIENRLNLSG